MLKMRVNVYFPPSFSNGTIASLRKAFRNYALSLKLEEEIRYSKHFST